MTPYEHGYKVGASGGASSENPYPMIWNADYDEWTLGYIQGWKSVPERGPLELQL